MILQVENLSKSFAQQEVIKNLNLELNEGEILLITGENGSGKSTFFRILSGLIEQDGGRFSIDGNVSFSPASEFDFLPNAIMRENLLFFASLMKRNKKQILNDIDHYSKELNVDQFLSTTFQDLSTGNKKKFALIRSLIIKPKLILLDEFLGPIDQETRPFLLDYISLWVKENKAAVLLSTHSLQDDYLQSYPKLSLN